MLDKPLAKAKKTDLEAELVLYVEALGADKVNECSNNDERVAEIERLRAEHGQPIKDGDTVRFLSQEELDEIDAAKVAEAVRAELLASLDQYGVELEGDLESYTNEDLSVRLAEAKDAKDKEHGDTDAVAVYNTEGQLVRVYSAEAHGKDYEKYAQEFVSAPKRAGFQVKPYIVPAPVLPPEEETEVVKVLAPSGDVIRVFSLSQHGEEYRDLAEQFVTKYASREYTLE